MRNLANLIGNSFSYIQITALYYILSAKYKNGVVYNALKTLKCVIVYDKICRNVRNKATRSMKASVTSKRDAEKR